jgi:tRNA uridine 5-carboxymethylaminomethyl modification enzyme
MFTSRAEFRLSLRCDNADIRLTPKGEKIGCVGAERSLLFSDRLTQLNRLKTRLQELNLTPVEAARNDIQINMDGVRRSAFSILSYPDVQFKDLVEIWPELGSFKAGISDQIEIDAKYAVYLERQASAVSVLKRDESVRLGSDLDYDLISGLSNEVRTKLKEVQPDNLGQAGRIEGVTPAALTLILAWVKKNLRTQNAIPTPAHLR